MPKQSPNQIMAAKRQEWTMIILKRSIIKSIESGFTPPDLRKESSTIVLTQTQMFNDSQINLINYN